VTNTCQYSCTNGYTGTDCSTPPPACGTIDCYTITQYTTGTPNTTTITTNAGKSLILRQSTSGFKYWQDNGGSTKILAANGLDTGGPNGDGWAGMSNYNMSSGGDFGTAGSTIGKYMTNGSTLEARVKPPKIYKNESDKFNATNWLYYDVVSASTQTLNVDGTDRVNGFTTWVGTTGVNSG